MFIGFCTAKNTWSAKATFLQVTFYTVLLQIHSSNFLQNIDVLDISLIKLQNQQGCNFLCFTVYVN